MEASLRDRVIDVVARFARRERSAITDDTPLDRTTVGTSLAVFRLFATLAAETGLPPVNPATIGSVGALLGAYGVAPRTGAPLLPPAAAPTSTNERVPAIGIDVQVVEALPLAGSDPFYIQSFSAREREYCERQPDPRAAYCGRFAAKEALIKCGAVRAGTPLADIEVLASGDGAPIYSGASLSISHAPLFSVAVAVRMR